MKTFKSISCYLLLAASMVIPTLCACGDDDDAIDDIIPDKIVTSIVLSETSISLQPDETKRLTATVKPSDAENPVLTWESSDEEVAKVVNNGLVLAIADGTCIITCRATDGSGIYAECKVTVRPVTNNNANKDFPQALYTETTTPDFIRKGAMRGMEIPSIKTGNVDALIVHTLPEGTLNYCVGYNSTLKANCWSAFKLYAGFSSNNKNWNRNRWRNGETFNGYGGTGDPFQPDPVLPEEMRINSSDYSGSGYQRGHILGSADRLNSKEANGQTFYLSNIMPQLKNFNEQGIWWNLENFLRSTYDQSSFRDTLYVVKGGTISTGNYTMINEGKLACPNYYYIAILAFAKKYAKTNGGYYAIAFWMKHEGNTNDVNSTYAITIDELESRTGIDFFCNLPDVIEDAVESDFYLSDWRLR